MVEAHLEFIWRTLRGLGVPSASADDAAQQVFLIAARKLDLVAEGSERSFLFATAKGVAANVRRSQARNREHFDEGAIEQEIDAAPNPEQAVATRQAHGILERLLDEMPEDMRTVFVLFELEGLATSAIAELLDVPIGTVASRLRRAREHFQRRTGELQGGGGGRP
jgi:RNA polymerase sigma-70 factor (ECF subfamily)